MKKIIYGIVNLNDVSLYSNPMLQGNVNPVPVLVIHRIADVNIL